MQPVSNYTATVNLVNPHGFPLRLDIAVTGYDLDAVTSTGRFLVRGPGSQRDEIVNTEAYTTVDIVNNQYRINIPADATGYVDIIEGRPYTWSFDGDGTIFRIQGDYKSLYDTGQAGGDPYTIAVTVGAMSIDVSFPDSSATGPQGPPGPPGPPGASGGGHLERAFDFSIIGSNLLIGSIPVDSKVVSCFLKIINPFANTSFSVGTIATPGLIINVPVADVLVIDQYKTEPNIEEIAEFWLFPSFTIAPSFGSGQVTIYYS